MCFLEWKRGKGQYVWPQNGPQNLTGGVSFSVFHRPFPVLVDNYCILWPGSSLAQGLLCRINYISTSLSAMFALCLPMQLWNNRNLIKNKLYLGDKVPKATICIKSDITIY